MIITKRYASKKDSFEGVRLTVYTNNQKGKYEAFYFLEDMESPRESLEAMTGEYKARYDAFVEKCIRLDGTAELLVREKKPIPTEIIFPHWNTKRTPNAELYLAHLQGMT